MNLMTIQEVSKLLRVSTMTLKRWESLGKIRAVRINDRGDRRYNPEEIKSYLTRSHE